MIDEIIKRLQAEERYLDNSVMSEENLNRRISLRDQQIGVLKSIGIVLEMKTENLKKQINK